MEIRSTRSFNAIPPTLIGGVLTCFYEICCVKCIVNILFVHLFIFSFSFNHCKFFPFNLWQTYAYLLPYLFNR